MAVHVDVCERGFAAVGGERGGGWVGDFESGALAVDERDDVGFDTSAYRSFYNATSVLTSYLMTRSHTSNF